MLEQEQALNNKQHPANGSTDSSHLTPHSSRPTGLDQALRRAVDWLLEQQYPDGYWWGELESNVSITAEHLMLTHILSVGDRELWGAIAKYLLQEQRPDGTWANWKGGPGDLSTTVEAYVALKMAGVDQASEEMARARGYILERGGVSKARVFTKIWLALLGEWPWEATPMLPPELILLPRWFPVNLYSFASWARGTILPLAIVRVKRPVFPLPPESQVDELFPGGKEEADLSLPQKRGAWAAAFRIADRILRLWERSPWKPLRKRALRASEEWIIARQEEDGCWGGIQPPWVYSLIALATLGHDVSNPVLRKGIAGFERYAIREEGTFRLQSCISPVWDTGLALLGLLDAGVPPDHPALRNAGDWLLGEQVFTGGDWQVRCSAPPGGWAFELDNDVYPDTDDSAVVLMVLDRLGLPPKAKEFAVRRGREWLLGMQSRGGGWGAFDRNNTRTVLWEIPFADFGELLDPPSADVSAHVVECLAQLGDSPGFGPLDHGLGYLLREQEEDGSWYGRWGVNHIYGTGAAVPALIACGVPGDSRAVKRAAEWLRARQNEDGGWGEDVMSYHKRSLRGRGPSTASQTAWALLALLAAGEKGAPVQRGVEYLIRTQTDAGTWEEEAFTGTGFPTDFMIRYHLYRHYFPLMALGRARKVWG
ncbi:MAG: squalene--hopene cyclase [Candidatus Bipolaricaulota bacterium]